MICIVVTSGTTTDAEGAVLDRILAAILGQGGGLSSEDRASAEHSRASLQRSAQDLEAARQQAP